MTVKLSAYLILLFAYILMVFNWFLIRRKYEKLNKENEELKESIVILKNWIEKKLNEVEQEPRKGEWLRMSDLSEQDDDRYKCSRCGNVIHHKNKMNLYTFDSWCGRCGSDNGIHINYEVEECQEKKQ